MTENAGTEQEVRILIVIPTFNNGNTLRDVTERALQTAPDVLVVDDGSTDGALETLNGLAAYHIRHEQNRGKGAAIVSGAAWAGARGYSHIITLDADGQHDPADIPLFVERVQRQPLSIIVGVRDFEGTDVPDSSVFGRKFSNFWVRVSCGAAVADSQSGFRAYPVQVLQRVQCRSMRYNFEVEILVRAVWAGLAVQTVPVSVTYSEATIRASHFRPFADNARISLTYTRLVLRNFFPWPHKILFGKTQHQKAVNFFLHPVKGMKALATENATPKQIAVAVTVGIFIATLPILAMHSVAIIFVATRLKLNRLIALNVSHLCAPPFVPAAAVEVGYYLRNGSFLTEFTVQTLGHQALQRFWDYLLGAVVLAPFLAVLAGTVAYVLARFFRTLKKPQKKVKGARSLG